MADKTRAAYAAAATVLPPALYGDAQLETLVWSTTADGNWNIVENWLNSNTLALVTAAPGIENNAIVTGSLAGPGPTITGPASVSALTLLGDLTLAATLVANALTIGATGRATAVTIAPGTTMSAGSSTTIVNASLTASGQGTTASLQSPYISGSSTLAAIGGAVIQGGILYLAGTSTAQTHITADAASRISIGNGDPGALGLLSIGQGSIVSGAGAIDIGIQANGTLYADSGTLIVSGPITGTGRAAIDPGASLILASTAISTAALGFGGKAAVLSIRALTTGPNTNGLNVSGLITGFVPSDTIAVVADPSLAVTSVAYTPTGTATGTLALFDGPAQLGTLAIAGAYTGETFQVTPDTTPGTYDIGVFAAGAGSPTYAIAATEASKLEGDSGTTTFTFTVTRSGSTASSQVLSYAVNTVFFIRQPGMTYTVDGNDFVGNVLPTGTITFAPGDVTKTITIPVQGDTTLENSEYFTVDISGAATITTSSAPGVIITDDANYGLYPLSSPMVEGNAGATPFTFGINRGYYYGAQTVHYAVIGTGANPADASDFGGAFPIGAIAFAAGDTTERFIVPVSGDPTVEPDKTFAVILTDVPTANFTASGAATILNDDAGPPPAGTATPDTYAWRAAVAGAWSAAANWIDLSSTTGPAALPPGRNDAVTITGPLGTTYPTITGPGAASSLTLLQNLTLASNLTVGNIMIGSSTTPGAVYIGPGSTEIASTASIVQGNLVVQGAAAQLIVSGTLAVSSSSGTIYTVDATSGGLVQAGSLTLLPGSCPVRLATDTFSRIEVGTAPNAPGGAASIAPLGTITVDPGATLSGAGSLETVVDDNGTIVASGGTLSTTAALIGNGQVRIDPGATFLANRELDNTGLVAIGPNSTLVLASTNDISTAPIVFTGAGAMFDISSYSNPGNGANWLNAEGTIAGFAPGDTISFLGATTHNIYTGTTTTTALTDIGYTPNASGTGGALSLFDNAILLGNLNLLGDYTGAVFTTTPTTTPFTYTITVARPDPLFDPAYYLAHNPDVAAAGVDPYQHYSTYGWKEGRDPSALFDTNFYLQQNPDVAAAGVNPLAHFEAYGWKENRDPSLLFSDSQYLAAYPDVKAAGADPLLHYTLFGQQDGRMTFLSGNIAPADPLVNPAFYDPQLGATLLPTGTAAAQQAAASYAASGWQKGLDPDAFFDTNYYLAHNPDVSAAHVDPLLHYELYGWQEGRDPSAQFSTSKYLAAYADVKQANVDPLFHYLEYGQQEGRQVFHT